MKRPFLLVYLLHHIKTGHGKFTWRWFTQSKAYYSEYVLLSLSVTTANRSRALIQISRISFLLSTTAVKTHQFFLASFFVSIKLTSALFLKVTTIQEVMEKYITVSQIDGFILLTHKNYYSRELATSLMSKYVLTKIGIESTLHQGSSLHYLIIAASILTLFWGVCV